MKGLQKFGGFAALVCAGTYILAMILAATVLTPMVDSSQSFNQFTAFFLSHQALIFAWHFIMYLVNGAFLTILVLALYFRLKEGSPALAMVAACFGLFWTVLVFADGFITLNGWEVVGRLSTTDAGQASMLRQVVDTVTIGLDHSDRFLGCLWVLLTSLAALRTRQLPKTLNIFGLVIGSAGIISSAAPAINGLGYAFGVGVIVWWTWTGIVFLRSN